MTKKLRLMIYDNTDVKANMQQVRHALPNDFLGKFGIELNDIDYEIPVGLTHSWIAGGGIYRALRWVDECKGFSSWGDALEWLVTHEPDAMIEQIQVWGHGSPGRSWIAGEPLHAGSIDAGEHAEKLWQLKGRLTDDALIWFRNCSVFCGEPGKEFARKWSQGMGCDIAAHTYVIGVFQSGLHVCSPGEEPDWDSSEGIHTGSPERPVKIKTSLPWEPNTIFMIRSSIPRGW